MKIVVAPDSFKGSLSAVQAARIIADALHTVFGDADIVQLPLADGGEGTLEVVAAALDAEIVSAQVQGPLGEAVTARYGLIQTGAAAIIESAAACGMALVPAGQLNPLKASSFGLGELIRDALQHEVHEIIVSLGGSATVDGGLGMAKALGYRLLDSSGRDVPLGGGGLFYLAEVDSSRADPRLSACRFRAVVDVGNPLCGPDGAAPVFAPQKGASPEMVPILDRGLSNLMRVLHRQGLLDGEQSGDGAAGGLGAALRVFCRAQIESGAEWVCRSVGFLDHLQGADLLVTGEGKTDGQTLQGKLCAFVSRHARARGIPVLLLSGALELDERIQELADFAFSISAGEASLAEQIRHSERNLARCAQACARLLQSGGQIII